MTPTLPVPERTRSNEGSLPADVHRVLARIERAAWLWRGRRHSLPGDERAHRESWPLSLLR